MHTSNPSGDPLPQAARSDGGATIRSEGTQWIVEIPRPSGPAQRFSCATELMAQNLKRALDRMAARPPR